MRYSAALLGFYAGVVMSLGCVGSLYADAERVWFPVSIGNSELTTAAVCVSGGPVSEGGVEIVGDTVQAALSILTGRSSEDTTGSQDTNRQSGCFVRDSAPGEDDDPSLPPAPGGGVIVGPDGEPIPPSDDPTQG